MSARGDTANSNATNLITKELGPKPDLDAVKADILDKAQKAVAPDYKAAYKSGAVLDAKPIVQNIRDRIPNAVGEKEKALKTIGSYFLRKDKSGNFTDQIKDTIPELHDVRMGLDAIIQSKNPTTSVGNQTKAILNDVRSKVDDLLKSNPQMKAADEKFAKAKELTKSIDYGNEVLARGGGSKEDFNAKFSKASPAEQDAIRKGMSAYIHEQMESASRGELSEAQRLFGKASRNRAMLKTAFGSKADTILDTLSNEASQRATEKAVEHGAQTAERTAVHRKYGEAPKPGIGTELAHGMMVDLAGGHRRGICLHGWKKGIKLYWGQSYKIFAKYTTML